MKGIVLAGGMATRLFPLTHTTSKQLVPVYDRQMIFYPLHTLITAGIDDILVIISPRDAGQFIRLLGPIFDKIPNISIQFKVQPYPKGLADAFNVGRHFVGKEDVALILGDNIFFDNFSVDVAKFRSSRGGCKIFLKEVDQPEKYGVALIGKDENIVHFVEKPKKFISNLAVVGFYLFDNKALSFAETLLPSERGELEIIDIIKAYHDIDMCKHRVLDKEWFDAGTYDDLLWASNFIRENFHRLPHSKILDTAVRVFNEEQIIIGKKQLR